jgi:hypothetical protein
MIAQGRGGRIIGKPFRILACFALFGSVDQLPNRCMLRHGQAGTSFLERLLREQIRYKGLDSVRW